MPTSGNSNTSSADPDGSLINSDTFSTAVDAPSEFPWTPKAFPNPRMICFPTDPIRMSLRPVPRLHPTTVNSTQFRQARHHILCPLELPSSSVGQHMLDTLFVKLKNPPNTIQIEGLPDNIVPVTHTTCL
ncbi:hypothetical protein E4T56_gene18577 [Termitomyces sp. T112]|nr:hypothetical protein E4T56_gene18577 [Termitomyces sp. T112]